MVVAGAIGCRSTISHKSATHGVGQPVTYARPIYHYSSRIYRLRVITENSPGELHVGLRLRPRSQLDVVPPRLDGIHACV